MDNVSLITKCMAIEKGMFLNAPYQGLSILELYGPCGIETKASTISHYCTIGVLKEILGRECLRFTDVRFLNDSTEFLDAISIIKSELEKSYAGEFAQFLLDSGVIDELSDYHQCYKGKSKQGQADQEITYRTYTCSFSTDPDSLNMWNYYAKGGTGVSIVFDEARNLFDHDKETDVNANIRMGSDIVLQRGVVLYDPNDKRKCISKLLDKVKDVYEEARVSDGGVEKQKSHILRAFKTAVNRLRCFFKDQHFQDEREYRMVLNIPEDIILGVDSCSLIVGKGLFERGRILIPYVDIKFMRKSIQMIVLNPYITKNDEMFELGIRELLVMEKMPDVKILHSAIPLRKYE